MADWVRWIMTVLYVISVVINVAYVGKERDPIKPAAAAGTVVLAAVVIFIIWKF